MTSPFIHEAIVKKTVKKHEGAVLIWGDRLLLTITKTVLCVKSQFKGAPDNRFAIY
jgi:hypothetical protein